MRKIIYFVLLLCLACAGELSAQWRQIKNIPTQFRDNYWLEIFFLQDDPLYGWACGFNGMVIRTTDGGESWQGTKIRNADQIESICFTDRLTGYIVSVNTLTGTNGSVVYKTTDGGATWSDDYTIPENFPLWGCYFLDANYGIVVGGYCSGTNLFYTTSDGGKSWSRFEKNFVSSTKLADVVLYPDNTGYAISSGRLWNTRDRGKTWAILSETGDIDWHEEIAVHNSSILVPVDVGCDGTSSAGGARFSRDGGRTWQRSKFDLPCYGSVLINDSCGWVCGKNRAIYFTQDYGNTWVDMHCGIPEGAQLDDLFIQNDSTYWVVGEGIFKHTEIDTLKPVIVASAQKICSGDEITLATTEKFENYLWNTGETTPTITVSQPGEYWLKTYTNDCDTGRSNILEIDIMPKPEVQISGGNRQNACEGDTVEITLETNADAVSWDDGSPAFSRRFTETGTHYFSVVDSNGCTTSDSVVITFLPYPRADLNSAGGDTLLCKGTPLSLSMIESAYKCDWYDAETGEIIAGNTSEISIYSSRQIYVIAQNEFGCADTSEVYSFNIIYALDKFSLDNSSEVFFIDSTSSQTTVCRGMPIYNHTENPATLADVRLNSNTEFSVPQSQFPLSIPAFGEANLIICFTPGGLYTRRDTLTIYDVCSSHRIILEGYCRQDTLQTGSKCGLPVMLTTKEITGGEIVVSAPYPNPISGKIAQIDYTFRSATGARVYPKITLTDLGGIACDAKAEISASHTLLGEVAVENGNIRVDVSGLASGSYRLNFSANGENLCSEILIIL